MPFAVNSDVLENGIIRKLSFLDQPAFLMHLLRLDVDSRRMRFGMAVTDHFLKEYSETCFRKGAVIYGYFVAGILRGAAELQHVFEENQPEGEVAFSVEADFRHNGVGSKLFEKLLKSARLLGYKRLYVNFVSENHAMHALAEKFSAKISIDHGESLGVIDTQQRSVISFIEHAIEDIADFAQSKYQKNKHWLGL